MVQRVAAVHDPSGRTFNVEPVTTLENGCVATITSIERKKEKLRRREEEAAAKANGEPAPPPEPEPAPPVVQTLADDPSRNPHFVNPDRLKQLVQAKTQKPKRQGVSKTQQKKQEQRAPRPPPPKPTVPENVELPDDEEEPWLDLWDLPDGELERRVTRAKRRAAQERKNLRVKQKQGKAERRAARDEKRRVYRELKQSWKVIREEERRRRRFLNSMEDEERKRLAVQVNKRERKDALECAARLGYTLENVEGVEEIKPRVAGRMKGMDIDWEKLEFVGDASSGLKFADGRTTVQKAVPPAKTKGGRSNRVNLGAIASEARTQSVFGSGANRTHIGTGDGIHSDFVKFGKHEMSGEAFENANLNHKLRRKLRRALETTQVKKEMLVREKAIEHCRAHDLPVPPELLTRERPINERGSRCMPNGTLETAKQERVRDRVELTEFNKMARVLRKQAKDMSIESGMRVYLELMGRIPRRDGADATAAAAGGARHEADEGRPMTAAEFLASWTVEGMEEEAGRVEREYGMEDEDYRRGGESDLDDLEADFEGNGGRGDEVNESKKGKERGKSKVTATPNASGNGTTEESSEDSAARQLQGEAMESTTKTKTNTNAKTSTPTSTTQTTDTVKAGRLSTPDKASDSLSSSSEVGSDSSNSDSESDAESSRSEITSADESEKEYEYEKDGDVVMRDA